MDNGAGPPLTAKGLPRQNHVSITVVPLLDANGLIGPLPSTSFPGRWERYLQHAILKAGFNSSRVEPWDRTATGARVMANRQSYLATGLKFGFELSVRQTRYFRASIEARSMGNACALRDH